MFFFCLVMLVCLQFVCASLSLSYLLVASALGEWGVRSGSICKQHILRKLRLSLRQTLLAGKTGNKLNQMKDLMLKDMIVLLPSSF